MFSPNRLVGHLWSHPMLWEKLAESNPIHSTLPKYWLHGGPPEYPLCARPCVRSWGTDVEALVPALGACSPWGRWAHSLKILGCVMDGGNPTLCLKAHVQWEEKRYRWNRALKHGREFAQSREGCTASQSEVATMSPWRGDFQWHLDEYFFYFQLLILMSIRKWF